MISFEVKNRFSNAVQFVAKIQCDESASYSTKMGLAVQWAVNSGANLGGAYLREADLGGAYLRGADLRGANLGGLILIARVTRSDDYEYFAWTSILGGMVITAGCRTWQDQSVLTPGKAIEHAREHCTHQTDAAFRTEALLIIDHIERMAA